MRKYIKLYKIMLVLMLIVFTITNSIFASSSLNTRIEIINHKLSGIIITNQNTNNEKMPGVKVRVINKDTTSIVGEYITDSNGEIIIDNLEQAIYQIQQIETISEYELDNNVYEVNVLFDSPHSKLTIINKYLGNIKIITKDSKTGETLQNAKFSVINNLSNESKEYTTDIYGEIFIEKMQTSNYTIEQLEAPEFYEKDNNKYTVSVVPENTTVQNIENEPYSDIVIYSIDNFDEKGIENTKFKLVNTDNDEVIGEYNTDLNGKVFIENLYPANYKIEQINIDNRYDPYSESKEILIELAKDPSEIKFYSSKKGGINIVKKNIDNEFLEGVKFNIFKEDNTFLGEYTTDENGQILLEYLDKGQYKVVETKTIDGYYLDPMIYEVAVKNQEKSK